MAPKYPSFPGKIEYGCLHQTVKDGPMDRVFIEDLAEAANDVLSLREKGVKAVIVTREVPEWNVEDLTVPQLRGIVQDARDEAERERQAHIKKLQEDEQRRRQEDDGLGWKEL